MAYKLAVSSGSLTAFIFLCVMEYVSVTPVSSRVAALVVVVCLVCPIVWVYMIKRENRIREE